MSVTVTAISGPDDANFIYLRGAHEQPGFERVHTVKRSWVAGDPARLTTARDALVAAVEQAYADYVASQEALANL